MRDARSVVRIACAGGAAIVMAAQVTVWGAGVENCTYKKLAVTPPPNGSAIPEGIDTDGTVVGMLEDDAGSFSGFILPPGAKMQTFNAPNAIDTAIMRRSGGVDVGFYTQGANATHGFVAAGGVFRTVDVPGALQTWLMGINRSGELVGRYWKNGTMHGVLIRNGTFKKIDPPGATWAEAADINDEGTIVGSYSTLANVGVFKGFEYRAGTYKKVKFPGAESTRLLDINARGEMIGLASADDTDTGFIVDGGVFRALDKPGIVVLPGGINIHESIVGQRSGVPVVAHCR